MDDQNMLSKSIDHIKENGIGSFLIHSVSFLLPEPYSTRFQSRAVVIADFIRWGIHGPLPFPHSIRACWYRFKQSLYILYHLDKNENIHQYLSEVERRNARVINDNPEIMDDKEEFNDCLKENGFGEYIPVTFGRISEDRLVSKQEISINELIEQEGSIVIKKITGGGGENVHIAQYRGGEVILRSSTGRMGMNLNENISKFDGYLVTEYCNQAEYSERIYGQSTNTIRILTYIDGNGHAEVAAAAHRFGSEQTGALDNFSQGGMSALIDLQSGELGMAAEPMKDQKPRWHESHPDTGTKIEGTKVPGWGEIMDSVQHIASNIDEINYAGWDIVVTESGRFKIIEANSYPNPDLIQVHSPLLIDEQVRSFYESHNIL